MSSGKTRPLLLLGEEPGCDNRERRLDEFGGLQRQARQVNPPPRALDLDPDHEGQRQQGDRDHEADEGDAAHRARRHQRDAEHDRQRDRHGDEVPFGEMQRRIAEPLGDGGARGHAHHRAEAHQQRQRAEVPAVDGPPPPRHRALIDPREHHGGRLLRPMPVSLTRRPTRRPVPGTNRRAPRNWRTDRRRRRLVTAARPRPAQRHDGPALSPPRARWQDRHSG
jgi:hypothetical protein